MTDTSSHPITDTEPTHALPPLDANGAPATIEDLDVDIELGLSEVDLNDEGPSGPLVHVMSDLWVGSMEYELVGEEFDAVLTLAKDAGHIPDTMRHRHVPLGTHLLDEVKLAKAVNWVFTQWKQDRTVLVRCDFEIDRAALVVALVCVEMGGNGYDSLAALSMAGIHLKDFRYRKHIYETGEKNHIAGEPLV